MLRGGRVVTANDISALRRDISYATAANYGTRDQEPLRQLRRIASKMTQQSVKTFADTVQALTVDLVELSEIEEQSETVEYLNGKVDQVKAQATAAVDPTQCNHARYERRHHFGFSV